MTQEEKARRYDEALEEAKKWHKTFVTGQNYPATDIKVSYEWIFPELKEPEEEKIRKALIFHYQGDGCLCTNDYRIDYKDICAWLEKQGDEDSQVKLPMFTFDDILALQRCMETVEKVQMDKDLYEKLNDLHSRVYDAYHLEKQCEPKSVWSEDDEYQINTILHELDLKRDLCKKVGNKVEEYRYDTQYNWLKSLKDKVQPQNTWKPSEEQMKCLSDVVHKAKYKDDTSVGGYSAYMPLASLYLDLKKLKEE